MSSSTACYRALPLPITKGLGSLRPLKWVTLRSGPLVTRPSTRFATGPVHLALNLGLTGLLDNRLPAHFSAVQRHRDVEA